MVRRERRPRVSVCGGRGREHAPTPKPSPKRQRNPATAQGRVGASTQGPLGGGERTSARASACALAPAVGQGTFLPRSACVVRDANQLRGGGGCNRAVARPPGTPDRSRRAQRAQRASPKARSLPCLLAHNRARSSLPPAIGTKATRRPGAAGRCGSPCWPWCGGWARKEARKSCKISKCPGLRRNTWHWREPAGPTGGRTDAHA